MVPDLALLEIFDIYMAEPLAVDLFPHNREVCLDAWERIGSRTSSEHGGV
jgi:hypothetical protein